VVVILRHCGSIADTMGVPSAGGAWPGSAFRLEIATQRVNLDQANPGPIVNQMHLSRRTMIWIAGAMPFAACGRSDHRTAPFEGLERQGGGRLGVAALDLQTGARIGYRADERFAMCSTFKTLLVAATLARVDRGQDALDRWIAYGENDLLEYAPVTRAHLSDGGMTLGALSAAAIEMSDNTAANLVLKQLDGPAGLTRWIRAHGDSETRLDRWEPSLNTAIANDPRDTTTPSAMVEDIRTLVLGRVLSPSSRDLLRSWLESCQTGIDLIRSRLPKDWSVGDKTGRGANGTVNDVAVITRPDGKRMIVAVYYTGSLSTPGTRSAIVASAGEMAIKALNGG
jgi:beta-lactamase class A